jgi:hypothetical protein
MAGAAGTTRTTGIARKRRGGRRKIADRATPGAIG